MKYKMATLTFCDKTGEGHVKLTGHFFGSDWVTQADALQDWIFLLERLYDKLFEGDHTEITEEMALEALEPKI